MASIARIWAASSLALLGTVAVYVGFLLNAAALGSTLGYLAILPGIVLIGIATLPLRALPPSTGRALLVGTLRYLSLPVFLLGAFMLAVAVPTLFSAAANEVRGLYSAALLTLAGLLAITWPELLVLLRWVRRGSQRGS